MARGDLLGHIDCPVCGWEEAKVKEDKAARAYIYCEDGCSWQGITRHAHQDRHLRARMRPVAAPKPEPVAALPDEEIPPPPAPKKPAGKPFTTLLG